MVVGAIVTEFCKVQTLKVADGVVGHGHPPCHKRGESPTHQTSRSPRRVGHERQEIVEYSVKVWNLGIGNAVNLLSPAVVGLVDAKSRKRSGAAATLGVVRVEQMHHHIPPRTQGTERPEHPLVDGVRRIVLPTMRPPILIFELTPRERIEYDGLVQPKGAPTCSQYPSYRRPWRPWSRSAGTTTVAAGRHWDWGWMAWLFESALMSPVE